MKPQPSTMTCLRTGRNWICKSDADNSKIKPRYKVGEMVYIKEPFHVDDDRVIYRYDKYVSDHLICKWENPYTMAANQARHFIEITAVRCERVQDISYFNCEDEGIVPEWESDFVVGWRNKVDGKTHDTPRQAYAALFDKINGKGAFERNEWVWVYDFRFKPKSFDEILEENKDVLIRLKYK